MVHQVAVGRPRNIAHANGSSIGVHSITVLGVPNITAATWNE